MPGEATIISAGEILNDILSGNLTENQLREAFLDIIACEITPELLSECVGVLREKMIPVSLTSSHAIIDTCGTGGSGLKTINTSTITAFIVVAAGGKVAKHGNRSASGNCGCFDLLEYLGIRITLASAQEQEIFHKLGIVFLFAPSHHPALRFIAALRKAYGKKTIFNLMGPLCNPVGVTKQILGTGNKHDAEVMANALQQLRSYGSMVVCGEDGLDEISITAPTSIYTVGTMGIEHTLFHPENIGMELSRPEEIVGGSIEENATIFLEILHGKGRAAHKNLVLVNAAHALLLAGIVASISEGMKLAQETLQSGKALEYFEAYRRATQEYES